MSRYLRTMQTGWGTTLLRIVMGAIFFREGAGKLFGWFGGVGFAGTCAFFARLGIPFPELNALLVGWTELLAGIAFLLGFLTRAAVIPIIITMAVAILTAHRDGGWSYPLLIIAASLVLLQADSSLLSLDRFLSYHKGFFHREPGEDSHGPIPSCGCR